MRRSVRTSPEANYVLSVAMGVALFVGAGAIVASEWRRAGLLDQISELEGRATAQEDELVRRRGELARIGAAVERITYTVGDLAERAEAVRRLVRLKMPDVTVEPIDEHVAGTCDEHASDAALPLTRLAWLETETAVTADSLATLAAFVRDRPPRSSGLPSVWPVEGRVTSAFGPRLSPFGRGREIHAGIDILARPGKPVAAGGDGEVLFAGRDPAYGRLVILSHAGDIDTFYGHLSAIYVDEGQRVHRGQPIGAVGATGRATGAHLHYEVRVAGLPVDPTRYIER